MLFKNNIRPAFAGASAGGQAPRQAVKNDAFMYDAGSSETDDFGAFNTGASSNGGARKPARAPKERKSGGINIGAVVIAVVVVAALVLVGVLAVALLSGNGKDVKYVNNSFISFEDSDGIWRVAANGKVLSDYEGDVELRIAEDRSFAYIIETIDEGNGLVSKNISYTDGKEIFDIATSVSDVLALASLEPGVIWLDTDNGILYYADDNEETLVRKSDIASTMIGDRYTFQISADATTVAYNELDAAKGNYRLCVYKDGYESTNYTRNMFVEAVSNDGSLIYASVQKADLTNSLYVVPYNDGSEAAINTLLTDNFNSIIAMNTKGNELVVATSADATVSTSVITFNTKKMEELPVITRICKGAICTPKSSDPEVACFSTFADNYFEVQLSLESIVDNVAPVYYLNKDFETQRVSQYAGKFSPDGDYFYYIGKNSTLKQVDLKSDDMTSIDIAEEVVDFEITQKGNVYYLGDDTRLMYYTMSTDKSKRVADNVQDISMHTYSNTLYYTYIDTMAVYCSKESTKSEVADIEGSVSGVPYFANADCKKTFVAFYDSDNDEWKLLYTANGKKFKLVSTCETIPGFTANIFEDIIPEIPTGTDSSEGTGTDTSGQ